MSKHAPPVATGPRMWVKWVVSLLVLAHFGAIVTAVSSAGGGGFTPPLLAVSAFNFAKPYLRFVFLFNAYRFYAPDPGPTDLAWFRLEYEDKTIRWIEFPRKDDYWGRMPYQRRLCIPMLLGSSLMPLPENPRYRVLSRVSLIYASSYARYLARTQTLDYADAKGGSVSVKEVQIFLVEHYIPDPGQVQEKWTSDQLRTYSPLFLGTFAADGTPQYVPGNNLQLELPIIRPIISIVTERIVKEQVYPALEKSRDSDPVEVMGQLRLPPAVDKFLRENPKLLDPELRDDNLEPRIQKLAGLPELAG